MYIVFHNFYGYGGCRIKDNVTVPFFMLRCPKRHLHFKECLVLKKQQKTKSPRHNDAENNGKIYV